MKLTQTILSANLLAPWLQARHWTSPSEWRTELPASPIFLESKAKRRCIVTSKVILPMKKITIVFLTVCIALAAGCRWVGVRGNGHIETDDRAISAFTEIDARGAFEIEWQSGPPALRITTDENLLSYVESDVSGDTLHLRTHDQIWPTHGIKVIISSPTRAAARIRGAVRLTAKQLTGPKFALEGSGASRVSLDGNVDELLADMTGASEVEASGLQTKAAEISTTGAGDAKVAVAEKLKVAITGAGKVTFSGNPTVEKHITGAGSVRRKD
ncbi:MAG TPA: head GIN domain-containing protein [Candidatus Acidoferrum sp.]|nr:head GIN domain-containing protein [Candidatus Acidoferrum sp.]